MQVIDNTYLAIVLVHVCGVCALDSSSSYSGKYVCMYVGRGVSPVSVDDCHEKIFEGSLRAGIEKSKEKQNCRTIVCVLLVTL